MLTLSIIEKTSRNKPKVLTEENSTSPSPSGWTVNYPTDQSNTVGPRRIDQSLGRSEQHGRPRAHELVTRPINPAHATDHSAGPSNTAGPRDTTDHSGNLSNMASPGHTTDHPDGLSLGQPEQHGRPWAHDRSLGQLEPHDNHLAGSSNTVGPGHTTTTRLANPGNMPGLATRPSLDRFEQHGRPKPHGHRSTGPSNMVGVTQPMFPYCLRQVQRVSLSNSNPINTPRGGSNKILHTRISAKHLVEILLSRFFTPPTQSH